MWHNSLYSIRREVIFRVTYTQHVTIYYRVRKEKGMSIKSFASDPSHELYMSQMFTKF
jgi:hypothetical protein